MNERTWNTTLRLTAVGVAIVSALSLWLAWRASPDLGAKLSLLALAPILAAAVISYALRVLRFHYFLTRSGVAISLRGTTMVQVVGFALSVTPGHVGEVFKLHLIRQRAGTPVVRTAPLLLLDRLTEGGGFLILAVAAALAMPDLRAQVPSPSWLFAGFAAMFAFGLVRHTTYGRDTLGQRLPKVPLLERFRPQLENLWHGLESSFTMPQVLGGLALSATARFADGLVLLFAAHLLGLNLPLAAAVLVLAVSGLAGGISLLPAGTGAVETTMVGLLVLLGGSLSTALGITLLARLSTLWLWVALGLAAAFLTRLAPGKDDIVPGP